MWSLKGGVCVRRVPVPRAQCHVPGLRAGSPELAWVLSRCELPEDLPGGGGLGCSTSQQNRSTVPFRHFWRVGESRGVRVGPWLGLRGQVSIVWSWKQDSVFSDLPSPPSPRPGCPSGGLCICPSPQYPASQSSGSQSAEVRATWTSYDAKGMIHPSCAWHTCARHR